MGTQNVTAVGCRRKWGSADRKIPDAKKVKDTEE